MSYSFVIVKHQEEELKKWKQEHEIICTDKRGTRPDFKKNELDGRYEYIFTPMSNGVHIQIRCMNCGYIKTLEN